MCFYFIGFYTSQSIKKIIVAALFEELENDSRVCLVWKQISQGEIFLQLGIWDRNWKLWH